MCLIESHEKYHYIDWSQNIDEKNCQTEWAKHTFVTLFNGSEYKRSDVLVNQIYCSGLPCIVLDSSQKEECLQFTGAKFRDCHST
jgi:hypothetical protein